MKKVPFYPQIWNLDNWRELGFESREDAEQWQNASCGVLCLKMAVEGLKGEEIGKISDVIRAGRDIGAYRSGVGWVHEGLARLAGEYDVRAEAKEPLSMEEIREALDNGCLAIASIKWAFKDTRSLKERIMPWKKRGGHLALVIGYDEEGFYVHHPSITSGYNWGNRLIPYSDFKKGYTKRGVLVCPA